MTRRRSASNLKVHGSVGKVLRERDGSSKFTGTTKLRCRTRIDHCARLNFLKDFLPEIFHERSFATFPFRIGNVYISRTSAASLTSNASLNLTVGGRQCSFAHIKVAVSYGKLLR